MFFVPTSIHDSPYFACILRMIAMLVFVLRHRAKQRSLSEGSLSHIFCDCQLIIKWYVSKILFDLLKISEIVRNL